MKNKLHKGARWLFRFRAYFSLIIFIGVIGGFLTQLLIGIFLKEFNISSLLIYLIALILIIIIWGEIYARMAYNRWLYEIREHDIHLERGIIWKRYSNIPYERIQNVDIHRGILARMLGFSTLMIQTAGYSMSPRGRGMHAEGRFPALGIETAERIREYILKRIHGRNQGL